MKPVDFVQRDYKLCPYCKWEDWEDNAGGYSGYYCDQQPASAHKQCNFACPCTVVDAQHCGYIHRELFK